MRLNSRWKKSDSVQFKSNKVCVIHDHAMRNMVRHSVVIDFLKPLTCIVKKQASKNFKPLSEEAARRQFGRRLKQLRKSADISQFNLAIEQDINLRRLSAWETGSDLKFSSIVKVCNALGISVKEFFSEGFE